MVLRYRRDLCWPRAALAALAVLLLDACETHAPVPVQTRGPSPVLPSEEVRTQLHRIGVVAIESAPTVSLAGRGTLGEAGSRGSGLSMPWAVPGSTGGAGVAFVLLPPIILGAAIVRAFSGAADAIPTAIADQINADLTDLIRRQAMQQMMREHVLKAAERSLSTSGPAVASASGSNCGPSGSELPNAVRPDATIQSCIDSLGFVGSGGSDPSLALLVKVRVSLIRTADAQYLYNHVLWCLRPRHKWTEWKAADFALLRHELEQAFDVVAESAVEEMFLLVQAR